MPQHMKYDENFMASAPDPVFDDEFDPYMDDPHNPRMMRLPQTIGCLIVTAAVMTATIIGGCSYFFGEKKEEKPKEQPKQEEKVQLPKKVASRMGSWETTWSQALQERGDRQ